MSKPQAHSLRLKKGLHAAFGVHAAASSIRVIKSRYVVTQAWGNVDCSTDTTMKLARVLSPFLPEPATTAATTPTIPPHQLEGTRLNGAPLIVSLSGENPNMVWRG
jgi:hypothetical protein